MARADLPAMIGIVGKKNSGKTTLLVGVAAELKRRGLRVASVKHGHHRFDIDHPGRDSWRHVHEGGVEAVLLLSADKLALVMQLPDGEPKLEDAVARHFAGGDYDVILVEGFKHGDLPKIEIHRRAVNEHPVYDRSDAEAATRFLAVVTDDRALEADCPVIALDPRGSHISAVSDLVAATLAPSGRPGG